MPDVVVCSTKAELEIPPVPSRTCWCSICAEELWISVTVGALMIKRNLNPVCIDCARGLAATDEPVYSILPEQEPELREAGILSDVKAFVGEMNRHPSRRRRRR